MQIRPLNLRRAAKVLEENDPGALGLPNVVAFLKEKADQLEADETEIVEQLMKDMGFHSDHWVRSIAVDVYYAGWRKT